MNDPIGEMRKAVADLRDTVRDLEARLDRQTLVARGLFALLREKLGLREAELIEHVRAAAPPEGVYARAPMPQRACAKCGRTMGQRRGRCLFCGAEWDVASAFEWL